MSSKSYMTPVTALDKVAGPSMQFAKQPTPMAQAAMFGETRVVRVRGSHDPLNHNQLTRS
ncbi:hypothetical protein GCM10010872_37710 [Dyella flava]|nr:hypothetical protein GCM10010872_37710 [Dyella flava]